MKIRYACCLFAFLLCRWPQVLAGEFDPGLAGFSVKFRGLQVPYREFGLYVLPESPLRLGSQHPGTLHVTPAGANADRVPMSRGNGEQFWSGLAPRRPGHYRVRVTGDPQDGAGMLLHLFVMHPRSAVKDGRLGRFRIGEYPVKLLRGQEIYRPPEGFVEVTEGNRHTRVSPHFTLGEFVSKQVGGFPKYVVLREALLLKLEYLLAEVNRRGVRADSFHIMSGYRTPWYNRAIGNVAYSRHVYGGAADIFVDADGDGVMDDLDGDGVSTVADAHWLRRMVESLQGREAYRPFVGGLAPYPANPAHGPFLHVDVRGHPARWGHRPR